MRDATMVTTPPAACTASTGGRQPRLIMAAECLVIGHAAGFAQRKTELFAAVKARVFNMLFTLRRRCLWIIGDTVLALIMMSMRALSAGLITCFSC